MVNQTTLLIRYTAAGDANLDGVVNALDFNALAANFGGGNHTWTRADFNYDGAINTLDFTLLANNFGAVAASPSLASLAPEPVGLSTIALGMLFGRRRRTA